MTLTSILLCDLCECECKMSVYEWADVLLHFFVTSICLYNPKSIHMYTNSVSATQSPPNWTTYTHSPIDSIRGQMNIAYIRIGNILDTRSYRRSDIREPAGRKTQYEDLLCMCVCVIRATDYLPENRQRMTIETKTNKNNLNTLMQRPRKT